MRISETKFWRADRVRILDDFAGQVADGLWEKAPYKIWRGLAHNKSSEMLIERSLRPDGNFEYTVIVNIIGLTGTYEDFSYTFKGADNSFGAYLDTCFGSPALSYQSEAKQNMYSDITTDTSSSLHCDYNKYAAGGYVSGNSITIDSNDYPYWSNTATSITWKTPCDEDDVRRICEDIINNKNKENKKMDTSNLFNFDFGPASSNQFRMSPYGLAVRTQANGWVAYNVKTGDLMDVDILNFDISKMIYKMPVALTAIKPGDILMHGGKPVFVREVATGGNTVRVIDYTNATVADILPVKSPFGFNFFTKVCPLFNFDQASANSDNPFGNMLPFLMLNGEKDGSFDPTLLFMASAMNGGNMDFTSNPMMLYCLMNRQDKGDILPFLMMMNGGLTGMGVSTPASSTPIATATT